MKFRYLKTLALFFILLTAIPLLTPFYIHLQQRHIRHQMKEKLEQQYLTTVVLEKKSVHWIKPGKEILLGDRMFDIKTVQTDQDHFIFTGLYDDEETNVVNKMKDYRKQENNGGSKLLVQLMQVLQMPCEYYIANHNSLVPDKTICYTEINESPLSQYKNIITPPPRYHS
jgi:hypothetical protein